MRTTLDIADDVFYAAKDAARREKRSLGAVVSDLMRSALSAPRIVAPVDGSEPHPLAKYGITVLPHRGGIVTNELINELRDDGPY
jgi:hypothetical protein